MYNFPGSPYGRPPGFGAGFPPSQGPPPPGMGGKLSTDFRAKKIAF